MFAKWSDKTIIIIKDNKCQILCMQLGNRDINMNMNNNNKIYLQGAKRVVTDEMR